MAESHKDNPEYQAVYMRQLNDAGRANDVVSHYFRGSVARNQDCKMEFLRAMKQLEQDKGQRVATGSEPLVSLDLSQPLPVRVETPPPSGLVKLSNFIGVLLRMGLFGLVLYIAYNFVFGNKGGTTLQDALGGVGSAYTAVESDVGFDDVLGIDEVKEQVQIVVEYLTNPAKFEAMGAKMPKGILLSGEPGTGKTLLAKAIAGEAGVPFFYAAGSNFEEVFVGVGARRIRDLFETAKKNAPCIIFVDEIDALGASRKGPNQASFKDATLNQLLAELDGFDSTGGVVFIGATNLPDSLDPALVRPGRFDQLIPVPLPDVKGRKQILDLYLGKIKHRDDVEPMKLAQATIGMSGADLANLVNRAAIIAVQENMEKVDQVLLEKAYDDVLMGVERKTMHLTEESKELTAFHEGGHAIVAHFLKGADPIRKATIVPRGSALGMVAQLPDQDQVSMTKEQLKARMAVCMGGRIGEEIHGGKDLVTTGASSDFQQATALARRMVTKWGMSDKVGLISLSEHDEQNLSPATKEIVEEEVNALLKEAYDTAMAVINKNKKGYDALIQALIKYETLTGDEITDVLAGKAIRT